jgi:hypothetical protein
MLIALNICFKEKQLKEPKQLKEIIKSQRSVMQLKREPQSNELISTVAAGEGQHRYSTKRTIAGKEHHIWWQYPGTFVKMIDRNSESYSSYAESCDAHIPMLAQ